MEEPNGLVVTDNLVLAPLGWVAAIMFQESQEPVAVPLVGWVWAQPTKGPGEWRPVVWDQGQKSLVPCTLYGDAFKGLAIP